MQLQVVIDAGYSYSRSSLKKMGENVKKIIGATMILSFAAFQSAGAVEKIRDVAGAALTCTNAPNNLGPRFLKYAKRSCKGRAVCTIKATNVAGSKKLRAYGCTDFSVVANCGDQNREVKAKSLTERLRVSC